jgi:CRISPR-associated endonuclease Csn1
MSAVRVLGIDLGIASCGWALIEEDAEGGRIVAWGVRTFDAPETSKERTPTNQLRRQFRGLRRVIRRRRQRMNQIRALLAARGLLANSEKAALSRPALNPWQLRVEALDRRLDGEQLAVVLGHIAKHRGFRSNKKEQSNAASEDSKMLAAIDVTKQRLTSYRTVGEMFARDPAYAGRKRNRDGDYTRSILRTDQEHEVRLIFERQRALGNPLADEDLRDAYSELAFTQRPLADSEDRIGPCPFEPDEKRAAKRGYSFELFRFLSRLNALRISARQVERALTAEEIARAADGFGTQRGMTFKRLRNILDLADAERFADIPFGEESKRDVVNRSAGNGAMQGVSALRAAVGEAAWKTLLASPEKLDRIAFVLTFRESAATIRRGLDEIGLPEGVADAVMAGLDQGAFRGFAGAGHISAKACRAIIPGLRAGMVYSDACTAAGYDHARRPETRIEDIANPVARKALGESLKQVRAVVGAYGLPDRIHVELARDVGKSAEEREEIRRGIEKRNKDRDRLRAAFVETVGEDPRIGTEDMLRFELWQEQAGRCLYTDRAIQPAAILAGDNSVQVDHILPWSRFGDDSFVNKTLCFAGANQEKRGRTPHEWLKDDAAAWEAFAARVETIKSMKGRKKRNYLLKDAAAVEEKFRSRNLNDTRYAARILMEHLARLHPADGTRRVFARPGALTDRLRRVWGLQDLKKVLEPDGEKRKADDRHHALDALIVAATSESALNRLTRAFQVAEAVGSHRDFSGFTPPWAGFVEEVRAKFPTIMVSRAERGRARGEAHAATIRQVRQEEDGTTVYERKAVLELKETDLDRVKDPERNAALVESLRDWIAAGKPKDAPPKSPRGDAIGKVRLLANKKVDVEVRGGAAERGEMVRVDVFRKQNRRGEWEFYLVPIYPHQVADRKNWPMPPDRAVTAHKAEGEWPIMDAGFEFLWSLHPRSFIEVERKDGTTITGYFMGFDRDGGQISISSPHSTKAITPRIGTRTLRRFEKFRVDRLGHVFPVARETRTWHGAACT